MEENYKNINDNVDKLKENQFNQEKFNSIFENNLKDYNNKLLNIDIIEKRIQNIENKNNQMDLEDNKKNNKYFESKKIDKYEAINNKTKIFKIAQYYNKILFKDITNNCENEQKENEFVQKIKITFKKDEEENDKIIYEVSNLYKDWDFKRHMVNIIKRINRTRIVHRVNLKQLKHIYIMKFNDKQIHFEKKEAINKIVQNSNFYVKTKNGFIFVNNKRRKFKNNRRNKFNNKKFNKNKNYNRNNNYKYTNNNKNNTNLIKAFANLINGNKRNNFNNNRNRRNKNFNNRFKNRYRKKRYNNNRRYNNINNNNNNKNYRRQNF